MWKDDWYMVEGSKFHKIYESQFTQFYKQDVVQLYRACPVRYVFVHQWSMPACVTHAKMVCVNYTTCVRHVSRYA